MAVPPRLTKLGAKWVEVRKRRARLPSGLVSVFENVASNTRWTSLTRASRGCPKLVAVASFNQKEAAGVGQPSSNVIDDG